jgi:O-antigen/teichoic acid export membrane protein
VTYLTVLVGAASSIRIYPLAFEDYGELRFVLAMAMFLYPLISLGVAGLAVKFFPEFNEGEEDQGLLPTLLLCFSLCTGLFGGLIYFNLSVVLKFFEVINFNPKLFSDNALIIWLLTFCVGFSEIIKRYTTNFGRVVVPEIISSTNLKIVLPVMVIGIYLNYVSIDSMKWFLVGLYAVITIGLARYLYYLNGFNLRVQTSFFTRDRVFRMSGYSLYGLLGSVGSVLAFQIDSIMVAGMETGYAAGQYFNALNMASFISAPQLAISAVAGPIISAAVFHGRWGEVADIYRQSSLNLCLVGLLVYLLLVVNLDDIFLISTNTAAMSSLYWPVIILGGAKVLDMSSGMNREIMGYSHLYVINLGIVLLLAVLNIISNYILIPIFGLTGAAIATFGSLLLANLMRFVFLWAKEGIQPFTWSHLELLLAAVTCGGAAFILPDTGYWPVNIFLRSSLVVLFILYANYLRGWSEFINNFLVKYLKIGRGLIKK